MGVEPHADGPGKQVCSCMWLSRAGDSYSVSYMGKCCFHLERLLKRGRTGTSLAGELRVLNAGAQIWSLVGQLRSHMPHGTAAKNLRTSFREGNVNRNFIMTHNCCSRVTYGLNEPIM